MIPIVYRDIDSYKCTASYSVLGLLNLLGVFEYYKNLYLGTL